MIQGMVRDVFGGGMETTQLFMIFSLLVLANRPHVQKKVTGYLFCGTVKGLSRGTPDVG